jgi:pimeloyl-ACP methyl ester carboxylesterase
MLEINVDLDGRRLYGLLAGAGEPAVILEAGLGDTAETWSKVQPEVAGFASVLSYDRAGLGRSDPAPTPRTCQGMVSDLRKLLSAANLRPPYILVAHSWSGLNARWYANQYPHEIAGLVLVDAVHEDKYTHFEKVLPEERASRMWASIKDPSKNDEQIDRMVSIEQVRSTQRSFAFPLIVLTRNAAPAASADAPDELAVIETSLQQEFLKLSPNSQQYLSQYNDHYIQNSEPGLVIEAIRQLCDFTSTKHPLGQRTKGVSL